MLRIFIYIFTIMLCLSCSEDIVLQENDRLPMQFHAIYPSVLTRATATSFEADDRVGVFVVADTAALEIAGNKVNNESLTFDGSEWKTTNKLYWDDGYYHIRAYYPYSDVVPSIEDYPFAVATDQSTSNASDFLFAASDSVMASAAAVPLLFRHILSRLVVRLIKGEDYEGDLPGNIEVFIHNTVADATIDLNKGVATKSIKGSRTTIKAHQDADNRYSAIIIPQRLSTRMPLIEVSINGISYLYESAFTFKAGTQHVINFIIEHNPEQTLISIGGEKSEWD